MSLQLCTSTTALMELPAVNGVIDDETNEIVYRNYVDVSVAMALPATGLVVPVFIIHIITKSSRVKTFIIYLYFPKVHAIHSHDHHHLLHNIPQLQPFTYIHV